MRIPPLKIGGVPEHFNLPWHLMMEAHPGMVEWQDVPGGTGAMAKLIGEGQLDAAIMLTEGAVYALAKGLEAKLDRVYVKSPLLWGIHAAHGRALDTAAPNLRYIISRKGSGSHLMAYIRAIQLKQDLNALSFVEAGTLAVALDYLAEGNGDLFLWEKFTTRPYVDAEKASYHGDLPTPWPCFVVVIRNALDEAQAHLLQKVLDLVYEKANELKGSNESYKIFSTRYGIEPLATKEWLANTEWDLINPLETKELLKIQSGLNAAGLI
jgi:sulfonate transport system substrate-binding protein